MKGGGGGERPEEPEELAVYSWLSKVITERPLTTHPHSRPAALN